METNNRAKRPTKQNYRQIIVELEITDVLNTSFTFVSNKELDKASRIISVESFHATTVPLTPTGKTVVPKLVHDKTFLKLADSSSTVLRTMPLVNINVDGTRTAVAPIDLESFDMQQSGVVIGSTAGLVAGNKFMFLFTYEKKERRATPDNAQ